MEAETSSQLPPPPQRQQQQPEVGEQFTYDTSEPSLGHVSAPPPPMQSMQQQRPAEQQPQNVDIQGDHHNTQAQHDVLAQKEDQPQVEAGQGKKKGN